MVNIACLCNNIRILYVINMNSKNYKSCAVPLCNNTSKITPNKVFVYVPHDKTLRYKWLNLARRDPSSVCLNSSIYFCEDHFNLPTDMINYMQYHVMGTVSQVRMKPGCVPTKFECQPDRRKRTSNVVERPHIVKKQRQILIEEYEKDLLPRGTRLEIRVTSSGSPDILKMKMINKSDKDTLPKIIKVSSEYENVFDYEIECKKEKSDDEATDSSTSDPEEDDAAQSISMDEPMCYLHSLAEANTTDIIDPIKTEEVDVTEGNILEETFATDAPIFAENPPIFVDNEPTLSLRFDTKKPSTKASCKENNTYARHLKEKLSQILSSAQFCGICLSTDSDVNSLNVQFEIVAAGRTYTRTLAHILHVVFRETNDILANSQICNICTDKLLRSYLFINKAKETARMLSSHVYDLYTKSCYLRNNVLKCSNDQQVAIDVDKKDLGDNYEEDSICDTDIVSNDDITDEKFMTVDVKIEADDENEIIMIPEDYIKDIEANKDNNKSKDNDISKEEGKDKNSVNGNADETNETQPCKYSVCEKDLCSDYNLQSHLYKCHNHTFKCQQCKLAFNLWDVLQRHILHDHFMTQTFSCDKCDWKFFTPDSLSKHRTEANCNQKHDDSKLSSLKSKTTRSKGQKVYKTRLRMFSDHNF